ncbi:SIP domain-containing protein [Protaetiibacter sp. SSC-01]|uniref:SIP domain-containing protein n=1 Tax=Protaetiibacter sp. SSC-01 TaxID=2759943 RepID=UPI0016573382|nr:SIP domain-containing protein [Protaetiibacter sp. SSC-01]QNO38493.1 SIP domain-containing protein [Protaetiibacter sp. SSC-01]
MLLSDVLPATIAWNPSQGDSVLLGAVDADLAIVETVLATLPAKARGQVFVEVADEAAVRTIAAPGRVCVTWLRRDLGQSLRSALDAWLSEMLPVEAEREHQVYAWISGDRAAHSLTSY